MPDLATLAVVLVVPAAILLGILAVAGMIVVGLAAADVADGRLVRPPGER
jgi:hypothetical protein